MQVVTIHKLDRLKHAAIPCHCCWKVLFIMAKGCEKTLQTCFHTVHNWLNIWEIHSLSLESQVQFFHDWYDVWKHVCHCNKCKHFAFTARVHGCCEIVSLCFFLQFQCQVHTFHSFDSFSETKPLDADRMFQTQLLWLVQSITHLLQMMCPVTRGHVELENLLQT